MNEFDEFGETRKIKTPTKPAFDYLADILSRGLYTEREIKNKLYERGYNKPEIEDAVRKALEYGYINDAEYAKTYIEKYSKTYGRVKIKSELSRKGIQKGILDDALADKPDDFDSALEFAEKFVARYGLCEPKNYDKLTRRLAYRGYGWSTVSKVLEHFKQNHV